MRLGRGRCQFRHSFRQMTETGEMRLYICSSCCTIACSTWIDARPSGGFTKTIVMPSRISACEGMMLSEPAIRQLIADGESVAVEFKIKAPRPGELAERICG